MKKRTSPNLQSILQRVYREALKDPCRYKAVRLTNNLKVECLYEKQQLRDLVTTDPRLKGTFGRILHLARQAPGVRANTEACEGRRADTMTVSISRSSSFPTPSEWKMVAVNFPVPICDGPVEAKRGGRCYLEAVVEV
jgi:hypothetical protein